MALAFNASLSFAFASVGAATPSRSRCRAPPQPAPDKIVLLQPYPYLIHEKRGLEWAESPCFYFLLEDLHGFASLLWSLDARRGGATPLVSLPSCAY